MEPLVKKTLPECSRRLEMAMRIEDIPLPGGEGPRVRALLLS